MIYCIWTCPRSLSTLTERVVINIGFKTIHEPFSLPYYYGPTCVSNRYPENKNDNINYYDVFNEIKNQDNIVIKDMATHFNQSVLMNDTNIINEMKNWTHIYLIRDPEFCVRSLYDMSFSEKTGWTYFDENEVGYKDLYDLYTLFGGHVIISEDLINDPIKFIQNLSNILNVPYDEKYLQWTALEDNIPQDWIPWKNWHLDALKSTNIIKKETSFIKKEDDHIKYENIYSCIEYNKNYYKKLKNEINF